MEKAKLLIQQKTTDSQILHFNKSTIQKNGKRSKKCRVWFRKNI